MKFGNNIASLLVDCNRYLLVEEKRFYPIMQCFPTFFVTALPKYRN